MAYVEIKYRNHSFEENPGLITWVQLFLLQFIQEQKERPEWTDELIDEWIFNAEIDIYKYFFEERLLDTPEKEEWAISFISSAYTKMDSFSLQEFAGYIKEDINPEVNFERLKNILWNIGLLLNDKAPISTH